MSTLTIEQTTAAYTGNHSNISLETTSLYGYPYLFNGLMKKNDDWRGVAETLHKFVELIVKHDIMNDDNKDSKKKIDNLFGSDAFEKGLININFLIEHLESRKEFSIDVPVLHAQFRIRPLGEDFGLSITGIRNNDPHESITKILQEWLVARSHGSHRLPVRPLIRKYALVTQTTFGAISSFDSYDMYSILRNIQKFVPWIKWFGTGSQEELTTCAQALIDQWKEDHDAIEIGQYNGIGICGRMLCGNSETMGMPAWRKGVIANFNTETGIVEFSNASTHSQGDRPRIEMSIVAPGFSHKHWDREFHLDSDARCWQHQFIMETVVQKILIGIGEYSHNQGRDIYYC